jgi:PKD repeat protein
VAAALKDAARPTLHRFATTIAAEDVNLQRGPRPKRVVVVLRPTASLGITELPPNGATIVPNSQSVRRVLLALAGLIAMLGTDVAVARAEYGEVGSPISETGKVSEKGQKPHAFGVDPTDNSFYVGDEVTQIEGANELHFYRIQKFSASGQPLAEIKIKAKEASVELSNVALEGIAVDAARKHVYVLVDRQREPEEEEPVFDPSVPAAATLYAFSTEVKNGEHKLEPAEGTKNAEGALAELNSESKKAKVALVEPHGIAVDPTNGEVVILGQEDLQTTAGGAPELRAAVQRVHTSGSLGSRYIDLANCLDEGAPVVGEPACSVAGQPFSPIVVPGGKGASEGKVYAERSGEIWELPSSVTEIEPKRFETHPKRLLPTDSTEELGSEQALIEFPKANEVVAEQGGGTMSFAPGGAEGEGRIYLTAAITTNAGILVLHYSEPGGTPEARELGWTGGQSESSGEKCSIPKKGNQALLVSGDEKEDVFVFDAHEKLGNSGSNGVDVFEFGPGGAGCPHVSVTTPSVKVKNNQGEEVEVSPVPLGEPAMLSSTVSGANAVKVKWKFKDLSTGEEEPAEEAGYEFGATSVKHKFEHTGKYEVTEIVETDDLANPVVEVKREVTVAATPIGLELSYPAVITVGSATRFEAAVHDPHESGTPHLKYVWTFGDGEEKSGEIMSAGVNEEHTYRTEGPKFVTLQVTDTHGVSAEVTREISVVGEHKEPEHKEEGSKPPPTKGPPPSPVEAPPVATLAATSLSVSPAGAVSLQVSCPASDSSCSGTVTLRTLGAVAARVAARHSKGKHKKKVVLTLASGSFTVTGGKMQTVTLQLSAKARTLLASSHTLPAQATIVAHDPAGATHTTQTTVTLRVVARHKHKRKHH